MVISILSGDLNVTGTREMTKSQRVTSTRSSLKTSDISSSSRTSLRRMWANTRSKSRTSQDLKAAKPNCLLQVGIGN